MGKKKFSSIEKYTENNYLIEIKQERYGYK